MSEKQFILYDGRAYVNEDEATILGVARTEAEAKER
jgi:hypothetical protein